MKTKEFIEKVKEMGFEVREYDIDIDVMNGNHDSICSVSTMFRFVLDTNWSSFEVIEEKTREDLYRLAVEYAHTPLDERKEEKKYRYEFPIHITAKNVETKHICRNHTFKESGESDDLIIDLSPIKCVVEDEHFHFTDKEVEQYTGKDRALFNACEKIEVYHD